MTVDSFAARTFTSNTRLFYSVAVIYFTHVFRQSLKNHKTINELDTRVKSDIECYFSQLNSISFKEIYINKIKMILNDKLCQSINVLKSVTYSNFPITQISSKGVRSTPEQKYLLFKWIFSRVKKFAKSQF